MDEVRFEGLSKKIKEIEIDGEKLKIKPKRKDVEMFCTLSRDSFSEQDAKKVFDILISMIQRANPGINAEDIEAYVTEHFGSLVAKIAPLFGFGEINLDQLEQLKKKAN